MHKHLRFRFQKRTLDQIPECYRQGGPLQLSNSNMNHQKHLFFRSFDQYRVHVF